MATTILVWLLVGVVGAAMIRRRNCGVQVCPECGSGDIGKDHCYPCGRAITRKVFVPTQRVRMTRDGCSIERDLPVTVPLCGRTGVFFELRNERGEWIPVEYLPMMNFSETRAEILRREAVIPLPSPARRVWL